MSKYPNRCQRRSADTEAAAAAVVVEAVLKEASANKRMFPGKLQIIIEIFHSHFLLESLYETLYSFVL